MGELSEQTDINTDLNSLCELPEGHKGLHVQGTETWSGYTRHEVTYWHGKPSVQRIDLSEPIETKTVTVIEEWSPNRMVRYIPRKDGTRHILESIENPSIPFVRFKYDREFSEEYRTYLACSQSEQPANTLPFELLSEQ